MTAEMKCVWHLKKMNLLRRIIQSKEGDNDIFFKTDINLYGNQYFIYSMVY